MKTRSSLAFAALALTGCASQPLSMSKPGQACAVFTVTQTSGIPENQLQVRRNSDGSTTYAGGDQISRGQIETTEVTVAQDGSLTIASRYHARRNMFPPSVGVTQDFIVSAELRYGETQALSKVRPELTFYSGTPLDRMITNARELTRSKVDMMSMTMTACLRGVGQNPSLLQRNRRLQL